MNGWAIGLPGGRARVFVQSSNPAEVLAQMQMGEIMSPVKAEHIGAPVRVLANMTYDLLPDDPAPDQGEGANAQVPA